MARKKFNYGTGVPEHVIETLARCFLPVIQQFFESEQGQREFAEWQEKRQKNAKNKSA